MKNNGPVGRTVIPLPTEYRSPKSDEEKLDQMLEHLIERANNKVLGEMRELNRNLERSVSRLLENLGGCRR